jgi:polyprenyl-phospho-N-acetylgalactosaminyl synthase
MSKIDNTWVVIPAYNEARKIGEVIDALSLVFDDRIIVVDDCSSDQTGVIVSSKNCTLVSHIINLGQGASLQTGIDCALAKKAKYIVTFDADGQHALEDAIKMICLIDDTSPTVICGSRFLGEKSENMPLLKLITLKLAVVITRLITKLNVTDAHNGLRVFNEKAARMIRLTQNRMAHATEIISIISQKKITYKEVPVRIIYTEYSISKGQKITNSINILLDLFIGGLHK